MRVICEHGRLILSKPETMWERIFLNTIHNVTSATGKSRMEFEVNSMSMGDEATHVGLTPIIPEEFVGDVNDSIQ